MNRGFYRQTSLIEDGHWWFRYRRRLIADLLRTVPGRGRISRALDVGCGTGGNLAMLAEHSRCVVGLDRSAYALELAREKRPDATLVQGDANRLGDYFSAESFDLITMLNVLYHRWVESEKEVLEHIHGLLKPGGLLVMTEPAFRVLFRRHDLVGFGTRRYARAELAKLVRDAGLELHTATYFNFVAFLPALLLALYERLSGTASGSYDEEEGVGEMKVPAAPINGLLFALASLERPWISALRRLPVGVGLMVLAGRAE
jgi:SAM-dependent methyltransferase